MQLKICDKVIFVTISYLDYIRDKRWRFQPYYIDGNFFLNIQSDIQLLYNHFWEHWEIN